MAKASAARKPVQSLNDIIRREIRQRGTIPFARFMELALYHPVHGYYERSDEQVGKHGDFYTSVSVGPVFGELLAFQFSQWLESSNPQSAIRNPQWIEAGAHDGKLAADILGWLRSRRPALFERIEYGIVEPSAHRQARQRERLSGFPGKIRWHASLAEARAAGGVRGILFGNELLDAMPVHVLRWNAAEKQWNEWGVGLEDDRFVWRRSDLRPLSSDLRPLSSDLRPLSSDLCPPSSVFRPPSFGLRPWLAALPRELLAVLPDGYTVETCPAAEAWWMEAAETLKAGRLVALDYGFTSDELLSPGRAQGTLRAYRNHTMKADVLADPGGQDLTAHVHFTAIESAGAASGLRTEVFTEQGRFLSRIMAETMKDGSGFSDWTPERIRQFQTLIHPQHLGSMFRVLVQSR